MEGRKEGWRGEGRKEGGGNGGRKEGKNVGEGWMDGTKEGRNE